MVLIIIHSLISTNTIAKFALREPSTTFSDPSIGFQNTVVHRARIPSKLPWIGNILSFPSQGNVIPGHLMMASFGLDFKWLSVASWSEEEFLVTAHAQRDPPHFLSLLEHQNTWCKSLQKLWQVERLGGLQQQCLVTLDRGREHHSMMTSVENPRAGVVV